MKINKLYKGMVWGALTVLEDLEPEITKNGNLKRLVKVKCKCGNIYDITVEGARKSGICSRCSAKNIKIDYSGKRIGKIKVLSLSEDSINKNRIRERYWKCICDCGNSVSICESRLKNNINLSCGCNDYITFYDWCIKIDRSDLFDFWDKDKNKNTTTNMIPKSSAKKYFWKCSKGHEWESTTIQILHSPKGKECLICNNIKVLSGYNDLKTLYPEIVKDWDYDKNNDDPSLLRPGSGKKVWWKCSNNHERLEAICKRVKGGCPICSGVRILTGYNDLKTLYPDIAKQWIYEKNKGLLPEKIGACSKTKVWWRCQEGHEWLTSVDTRTKGNNCPYCTKHGTSFPEQIIYFYFSKYFCCTSRDKSLGFEFDLFIKDKKVAIEYDGCNFHSSDTSYKRDMKKNIFCKENNIKLYRIRENGCHDMNEDSNIFIFKYNYRDENNLENIIEEIAIQIGIKGNADINIERDRLEIMNQYYSSDIDRSILKLRPDLAEEWHPYKNKKLTPDKVPCGSNKKVWWLGKCGHEYFKSPNERTRNATCSLCAKTRLHEGINDLLTLNPELCKEWDYEKNYPIDPSKISSKNQKKVWWLGKCGHSWKASINSRASGKGCPYCYGRFAIKGENDLETLHPDVLCDWNYEKNKILPSDVKAGSETVVWWKCSNCGLEYKKSVIRRVQQKYPCADCYPLKIKKIRNIETGEIFDSLVDAANKYNVNKSGICFCCKGRTKTCAGYHWEYVN